MPTVEVHVRESLARTGKGYQEVHEWVDDATKKAERHDIKRLLDNADHVKGVWGPEAAQEYVIHIRDDIKGRLSHVQEDYLKQTSEALVYFGIK